MKTGKFNLKRRIFLLCITFGVVLTAFPAAKSFSDNDDVTGSVSCKELGRAQGVVQYKYDITLNNNTDVKLKVNYQVIIWAGSVRMKTHNHSTILIPGERLTETNYGKMSESDWELATGCSAEWQWEQI
ncbi:MAG: hypothetical protein ACM3YE_02880 [Bacteroidota bacterium]